MKILLLNDNPVVNKLVTLSAQKSSDELDIFSTPQEISQSSYDLVIVDDEIGDAKLLDILREKVTFFKSLYICSKDTKEAEGFDALLKKPFLPTELVELFAMFAKETKKDASVVENSEVEDAVQSPEDVVSDNEDDIFEDIPLDEQVELDSELLELDSDDSMEDTILELDDMDEAFIEEESLEKNEDDSQAVFDETLIDEDALLDNEEGSESILDDEEAQKVKDLLDETSGEFIAEDESEEELILDDTLENDFEQEEDLLKDEALEYDIALDLEDEVDVDISEDIISDLEAEEEVSEEIASDLEAEEEVSEEIALDLEDADEDDIDDSFEEEPVDEILEEADDKDIEQQIQEAVEELSEEDLESELDDETLLEIAASEIDSIDALNSKDLKLALGEDIDEEEREDAILSEEEDIDEDSLKERESENEEQEKNEGVEALKKLLEALSDKNVAASMKGMKITINIELDSK